MTKADIVEYVYEHVDGLIKKQASEYVETLFDLIKDELAAGKSVKISGFGSFIVRHKRERMGRNPQTGEPMVITARSVVSFKPSQLLNKEVNR
jgi:integration host factor subunit alpha